MANDCKNTLTITGPRKDVEAFQKHAVGIDDRDGQEGVNPFCFSKLAPIPEHITADSQDWSIGSNPRKKYWGCDSFADNTWVTLSFDDSGAGMLVYDFFTKWTPPICLAEKVSACHPNLTFTLVYSEPGNAFAGLCILRGGRKATELHGQYDPQSPDEGIAQ